MSNYIEHFEKITVKRERDKGTAKKRSSNWKYQRKLARKAKRIMQSGVR